MHGVVFAFLHRPPQAPPANDPRATLISRCSESIAPAALALVDVPSQFSREHGARDTLLTAGGCANLFVSVEPTDPNFASRLAEQNNAQP